MMRGEENKNEKMALERMGSVMVRACREEWCAGSVGGEG